MFFVKFTDEAKDDFRYFTKAQQKVILDETEEQLSYQPRVETKHRKELRENPIASYELRLGDIRVFYNIYEEDNVVDIVAIGWKEHNDLYIRGVKVKI
mgnify:CR=1 FL=1